MASISNVNESEKNDSHCLCTMATAYLKKKKVVYLFSVKQHVLWLWKMTHSPLWFSFSFSPSLSFSACYSASPWRMCLVSKVRNIACTPDCRALRTWSSGSESGRTNTGKGTPSNRRMSEVQCICFWLDCVSTEQHLFNCIHAY